MDEREQFREADRLCKGFDEAVRKLYAGMSQQQLKEATRLRMEMVRNWAKLQSKRKV